MFTKCPHKLARRSARKADTTRKYTCPPGAPLQRKTDSTLIKALARAFLWKRMLESGEFATNSELADREKITLSYMTRVLRLTLLAPDIVEASLDGRQEPEVTLARLLEPFPVEWERQPSHFGCARCLSCYERSSSHVR